MLVLSSMRGKPIKILVLNPNSSQSMTDGLKPVINSVDIPSTTTVTTWTGPAGAPASINNAVDIAASHNLVLEEIVSHRLPVHEYDGVVVACFSVHPLVPTLRALQSRPPAQAVTGIFEAATMAAVSLLEGHEARWGIVTTGRFWVDHLRAGVDELMGGAARCVGIESTGLDASDLHGGVSPEKVTKSLHEATHRLLAKGDVQCIVMGCAGMAGLEATIRSAAQEVRGDKFAYEELHVVDGVRAAVLRVEELVQHLRWREGAKARLTEGSG